MRRANIRFRLAIALVLSLGSSAAAAQPASPAARLDPRLLKPHLVEVQKGRRLNVNCIGAGSPTVVFEQGGEGMVFNWAKVQPAITALTRTCFYDRGGFGYSDPPAYPVTALSVTDDLRALLKRAGVTGQVVLVGHSVGGFYATMYADRFPEQVAGLVLVDPGFTGQNPSGADDRSMIDQGNIRRGEGDLLRCAELARQRRLDPDNLKANRCFGVPAAMGAEETRYAVYAVTRPHWYAAEFSQSVHYFTNDGRLSISHQQERDAARPFGDLPMIVLTSDTRLMKGDPWRTEEELRTWRQAWEAGNQALATRSTRGKWRFVPEAGHFIQIDKPSAVIEAIAEVVGMARAGK